jgi:bisphosphoglycerate-dependent phosphoglycerate mutase
LLKVLVWKTNFDINPPSIDLQQNKSQITSLKEKSQSETNDERQARKVKLSSEINA